MRSAYVGSGEGALKNLCSLDEIARAKSVFIYNAFSTEAPTMPAIERFLREGKTVYLPRVENGDMVAVNYQRDTVFTKSGYGILEPTGEAYCGEIDVAVMPLLAVDKTGVRLGYGGGYYDRFLRDRNILKIAYCYECQVVDRLPQEEHDIKADIIVTDKQIIKLRG